MTSELRMAQALAEEIGVPLGKVIEIQARTRRVLEIQGRLVAKIQTPTEQTCWDGGEHQTRTIVTRARVWCSKCGVLWEWDNTINDVVFRIPSIYAELEGK